MRTHVWDVDGTLIASNQQKAAAFWLTAANRWGEDIAATVMAYHQKAGSISREDRWRHIYTDILELNPSADEFEQTVAACTHHVTDLCASAQLVPGAREFVESCEGRKLVVSGIAQPELDTVLERHGLADLFAGAFGGEKQHLLTQLRNDGIIVGDAVYYGDTRDDWHAATAADMDFVLVTCDTEWAYFDEYDGPRICDFTVWEAA